MSSEEPGAARIKAAAKHTGDTEVATFWRRHVGSLLIAAPLAASAVGAAVATPAYIGYYSVLGLSITDVGLSITDLAVYSVCICAFALTLIIAPIVAGRLGWVFERQAPPTRDGRRSGWSWQRLLALTSLVLGVAVWGVGRGIPAFFFGSLLVAFAVGVALATSPDPAPKLSRRFSQLWLMLAGSAVLPVVVAGFWLDAERRANALMYGERRSDVTLIPLVVSEYPVLLYQQGATLDPLAICGSKATAFLVGRSSDASWVVLRPASRPDDEMSTVLRVPDASYAVYPVTSEVAAEAESLCRAPLS